MVETAIVAGVGPAQGLGAVLARRIAKDGLHVVVAGRTMEKLDAVAASIRAEGGAATPVVCDVTDEQQVISLWNAAEAIGPVSLAIYNAGNNMPGKVSGMTSWQSWPLRLFPNLLIDDLLERDNLVLVDMQLLLLGIVDDTDCAGWVK